MNVWQRCLQGGGELLLSSRQAASISTTCAGCGRRRSGRYARRAGVRTRTFRSSSAEPEHRPWRGSTRTGHATSAASSCCPGVAGVPSGPAEGKVAALSPLGRSCCLELQLCRRGCVEGRDSRTRLLVVVPRSCSCAVGAARRGNVAALATWWPCLPRSCSCALSGLRGGRQGGRARHLVVLPRTRSCSCAFVAVLAV